MEYGECPKYEMIEQLVSGLVYQGPCLVSSIIITGVTDVGSCILYDGFGTSGKRKGKINVPISGSAVIPLPQPVVFYDGLYVVFDDANTTGIFVVAPLSH